MRTAQQIADRVRLLRQRDVKRDQDNMKVIAIRKGDYEAVAPGLFNSSEFDRPLVANLIDTTARDLAEVMAPLPSFNCHSPSLSNKSEVGRQETRSHIANYYVQHSRLQDQMFAAADRYGSFGFMAFITEPDFEAQCPVIRMGSVPTAHYTVDYLGRTREYVEVFKAPVEKLKADFPEAEPALKTRFGQYAPDNMVEVARVYDNTGTTLVALDPVIRLSHLPSRTHKCAVRIVERPTVTGEVRGQFDDVIWVQIARALVQMYTMNALEQSVNAPIAVPKDVQEMEIGPFTVVQSDNPQNIGRVNLQLAPGLFPEQQILAQEQRTGSRYPEGRSGSIDASIVTGQGVQALMGTFDTQVQTFQRLMVTALEDVIELCFEMDEAYWPDLKKTIRVKDNGTPLKVTYTPSKDIKGDHSVDVSYGAIAGLDPNRGLVFVLQALAGGLISKTTARRALPVDMNPISEELQINLEGMDGAMADSIAQMALAIPQMAMGGMDPRELVLQFAELREAIQKGELPHEAAKRVFAPKQEEQPAEPEVDPMAEAVAAAQGGDPAALPGQGSGGASDMLMMLAGQTPSGNPNLQANVSRMAPI